MGSIAIDMLAAKGFNVVALTGKSDQHDYLSTLGASEFVNRHELEMGSRPLEKGLWGGAVDNVVGIRWVGSPARCNPGETLPQLEMPAGSKSKQRLCPLFCAGFRFWVLIQLRCQRAFEIAHGNVWEMTLSRCT